jgi:hypothetical protein
MARLIFYVVRSPRRYARHFVGHFHCFRYFVGCILDFVLNYPTLPVKRQPVRVGLLDVTGNIPAQPPK